MSLLGTANNNHRITRNDIIRCDFEIAYVI